MLVAGIWMLVLQSGCKRFIVLLDIFTTRYMFRHLFYFAQHFHTGSEIRASEIQKAELEIAMDHPALYPCRLGILRYFSVTTTMLSPVPMIFYVTLCTRYHPRHPYDIAISIRDKCWSVLWKFSVRGKLDSREDEYYACGRYAGEARMQKQTQFNLRAISIGLTNNSTFSINARGVADWPAII